MSRLATALMLWTCASPAWAATGQGTPPLAGAYAAQMCVTVAAQERHCGPVEATLRSPEDLVLRVDDIRYRLQLRLGTQVLAFVFHGGTQIDEFSGQGRWLGNALEWFDQAKSTRYLVQLGARLEASALEPAPAQASAPK